MKNDETTKSRCDLIAKNAVKLFPFIIRSCVRVHFIRDAITRFFGT